MNTEGLLDPGDSTGLTFEFKVQFRRRCAGRAGAPEGEAQTPLSDEPGRVPRISRLMALAIRFDDLLRQGEIRDYADLARLGHVSRARITQVMNLLNLAPDIQEEILYLPSTVNGHDPIAERDLRPIVAILDWTQQRRMWKELKGRIPGTS